jgi:uncharacterized membrane protein YhaH (DUF805 family)
VTHVRFNGRFLYVTLRDSVRSNIYSICQLITVVMLVETQLITVVMLVATLQFANTEYP